MTTPSALRQALEQDVQVFNVNVVAVEALEEKCNEFMSFVHEHVCAGRLPAEHLPMIEFMDAQTQRLLLCIYNRATTFKKMLDSSALQPAQISGVGMYVKMQSHFLAADIQQHAEMIDRTRQMLCSTYHL